MLDILDLIFVPTLKTFSTFSKAMTPSLENKILRINLNENIYGTFVEIGAGQEVVRGFYRVGGASGTIAKSMSAYDRSFSDSIYGKDGEKRYVTQNRLDQVLDHEMKLLEQRISRDDFPNKFFFVYANTVATIDFVKKFKGIVIEGGVIVNSPFKMI